MRRQRKKPESNLEKEARRDSIPYIRSRKVSKLYMKRDFLTNRLIQKDFRRSLSKSMNDCLQVNSSLQQIV